MRVGPVLVAFRLDYVRRFPDSAATWRSLPGTHKILLYYETNVNGCEVIDWFDSSPSNVTASNSSIDTALMSCENYNTGTLYITFGHCTHERSGAVWGQASLGLHLVNSDFCAQMEKLLTFIPKLSKIRPVQRLSSRPSSSPACNDSQIWITPS
jgi:hypothetical protein